MANAGMWIKLGFSVGLSTWIVVAGMPPRTAEAERARYMPVPGERGETAALNRLEALWHDRLTYPTGLFDPAWVRAAALADRLVPRAIPGGLPRFPSGVSDGALAMSTSEWTALGPQPLYMSSCSGCYDYGLTSGRVNALAIDPTTTTPGSIVAYAATVGGGVWKTTNCCTAATTWSVTTDNDPLIATTSVDTVTIDPNDHNTIYAGTGDLNYGSFSMGSQGILKSTDAGATWTVLGAEVFGPSLFFEAGRFPQYEAVGKVRVDPNDGNKVIAGTKRGLFLSYDAGASWTGPCLTNAFPTQRQDITGLELSDITGTTRIIAAVGVRGFATPVQYNLGENGANGIYRATMPASGCPVFTPITTNANGWTGTNAASGAKYVNATTGNQLGRIDIAVAPSDPNYIYAQVSAITVQSSCGAQGCQLGAWRTTDGGTTWTQIPGSQGADLLDCEGAAGDYAQNWYDQGVAVDPLNPNRVFFDTFEIWFWDGSNPVTQNLPWNDLTCGYGTANAGVHVDQHALAFVPGQSAILLAGNDGGVHVTATANTTTAVTDPTWANMDSGFNTIEWYAGDISGDFATSATPSACGGAQDNGASAVSFTGAPTGPAQWNMGLGGDGFSCQIDPLGNRYYQGNNSGGISRCTSNCTTSGGGTWSSIKGGWGSDLQSFILPINLFRGGIEGGDDCTGGACTHLLAATTRVWETVTGASAGSWYITNNPAGAAAGPNLTKGTLGNRSFINQVKYSPKFSSVAIVGTNDGNVQIGFNLGTGVANQARWIDVTGGNVVLPNRPVLGVALDPAPPARELPVAYAAVGGFNANTPATPGHVFRVTCATSECATFTWQDKSGNLPDIPVDSIIANPNIPRQVFAGTDWGVYFTDDITAASPVWARFENGLPHTMVWDMSIDRGSTTLAVFTRGRGTWTWPLPVGSGSENHAPVADAGADFAADEGTSVQLAGSASDVDAEPLSYSWQQVGGPTVALTGADTPTPLFTAPQVGADTPLTFRLTVADPASASSVDDVVVTVRDVAQAVTPFAFAQRTGVATGVYVSSETKTVAGFTGSLPIAIDNGGQYRINNGSWTGAAGTIASGSTLAVRHVSAASGGTEKVSTVTVGSYATPFRTVTSTDDRTPDAFDFGTKSGVAPGAVIESDPRTPASYNVAIALVPGAGLSYRIGAGEWQTGNGTLQPGQSLQVRHTASATSLAYTRTFLKVGGVTAYFTTRTQ
jgi:hypothetical protein